jgi:dipeptidyl-peptidase-4
LAPLDFSTQKKTQMNNKLSFLLAGIIIMLCGFPLSAQENSNALTLEKVMKSREFSPKSVRGIRPMKDGEHFTQIKKDSINSYSYKTGKLHEVIVTSEDLIPEGMDEAIPLYDYEFNSDETMILFATETEAIYRRSSKSNYYIFNREETNAFIGER